MAAVAATAPTTSHRAVTFRNVKVINELINHLKAIVILHIPRLGPGGYSLICTIKVCVASIFSRFGNIKIGYRFKPLLFWQHIGYQVINRVSNFWSDHKLNRVRKIEDFGHKYNKSFGKRDAHPTQFFGRAPRRFGQMLYACLCRHT